MQLLVETCADMQLSSNYVIFLPCSLSAYWLGASPQTFYKYYTVKAVVLYSARFYLYKAKNWHYYMLEFCYFANILLLLEVWVFPRNPTFHKVTSCSDYAQVQIEAYKQQQAPFTIVACCKLR